MTKNDAAEQAKALETIKTLVTQLEGFKKRLKAGQAEQKGESNTDTLATSIDGLHGFFKLIRDGIDCSAFTLAFRMPGMIKGIKKHLVDKSSGKNEGSGTKYLLSLFNFPVNDAISLDLAKSLINILKLIEANNKGFIIGLLKMCSDTAQQRLDGLAAQRVPLEARITAYVENQKALNAEAQQQTQTPPKPVSPASSTKKEDSTSSNENSELRRESSGENSGNEQEEKFNKNFADLQQRMKDESEALKSLNTLCGDTKPPSLSQALESSKDAAKAVYALTDPAVLPDLKPLKDKLKDLVQFNKMLENERARQKKEQAQEHREKISRRKFAREFTKTLKTYEKERAKTFSIRDFFSGLVAKVLRCFGYEPEKQLRFKYIHHDLLPALTNYVKTGEQDELNDTLEKGISGADAFKPRAEAQKSLRFFLCQAKQQIAALVADEVVTSENRNEI